MIDPLLPFVRRRGAAVLDGGLATELEARGLDLDDPLWSSRALIENPAIVEAVHTDYLEAGADVITTATYQATIPGLVARGLSKGEARRVLLSGIELARNARDTFWAAGGRDDRDRPSVAASIGSYGAFLADGSEYCGSYGLGMAALAGWHRERLVIIEQGGADVLAFETIPSILEVEAIVRLLAERDGPPAWISVQARDAACLADGAPIEAAAALAGRCERVVAFGVNCVAPALVAPLLARCAASTAKALVAYPNRGGSWDAATRSWVRSGTVFAAAESAAAWRAAGARLIGGCCLTTPDDIRAIASAL